MSPVQAKSAIPRTPALAPASVRGALDTLRTAENYARLKRATSQLLSSVSLDSKSGLGNTLKHTLTEAHTVCDPSLLDYVVARLANGASVSTGFTRVNFTFGLYSVLQNHPHLSAAVLHVLRIYSAPPDPSDGPTALREHVLGGLSSAVAIVAAAGSRLSLDESRDIIKTLRVALQPDHVQWRLSPAISAVISRLLRVQSEKTRSQLVKPLWAICSARPQAEHSLTLALTLLLKFSLVSPSAVHALYPSLDSPLTDALLVPYETGLSYFDSPNLPNVSDPSAPPTQIAQDTVPHAWRLVLQYIASGPSVCVMKEDVCTLWRKLVVGRLLASKSSLSKVTKPLHAVQLLPDVFQNISSASNIPLIIDEPFSNAVFSLLRTSKQKSKSQHHRQTAFESIASIVSDVFCRIPRDLALRPTSVSGNESTPDALVAAFWRAIINNGLGSAFGNIVKLTESLESMSRAAMKLVISEGIGAFARPPCKARKSSVLAVEFKRSQVLRFLVALSRSDPSAKRDVIRALSLYSMFKPLPGSESTRGNDFKESMIPFDIYQPRDPSFAGGLPLPSPVFSDEFALGVYNRVMDLLIEKRINLLNVEVCFDTFNLALDASGIVEARCWRNDSVKSIQVQLMEIVRGSLKGQRDPEDVAVFDALKLLALYLGCELMGPRLVPSVKSNVTGDGMNEIPAEEIEYANRLIACYKILNGREQNRGDLKELEADNIERISHLICVYIGREKARLSVGLQAIQCLGDSVDDRVTAVFFDVMDSYSEGIELFDVAVESSEDSDEGFESGGVENGDKSESETEDESDNSDQVGKSTGRIETLGRGQNLGCDESCDDVDEDESDPDVDIEAEDEETLKALDNHLSQHMRLITERRKLRKQQKAKGKSLFRVTNILKLLEKIVRSLRIRLECSKPREKDTRTALVFLDVLVRLFEFSFSNEVDNLEYLAQVTKIAKKQMCEVPPTVLVRHISDSQPVLEILERLFRAVVDCKRTKILREDHVHAVSAALHLLMTVCTSASENTTYSDFIGNYEKLLDAMLRNGGHIVSSGMFSSFLRCGGDSGLKLINTAFKRLEDKSMSKTRCTKCAELIDLMARTIQTQEREGRSDSDDLRLFWASLEQLILSNACTESSQMWNSSGLRCLLHAVCLGFKGSSELDTKTRFENPEAVKVKLLAIARAMKLEMTDSSDILTSLFGAIPRNYKPGKRGRKTLKSKPPKKQRKI